MSSLPFAVHLDSLSRQDPPQVGILPRLGDMLNKIGNIGGVDANTKQALMCCCVMDPIIAQELLGYNGANTVRSMINGALERYSHLQTTPPLTQALKMVYLEASQVEEQQEF